MNIVRFSLILLCFAITGCSTTGQWWKSSNVEYLTHTVRYPGEHLFLISQWYTGNGHNWQEIKRHNPDLKPEAIHLGQQIRIPAQMVRRGIPLKQSAVAAHTTSQPRVVRSVAAVHTTPVVVKPSIGLPMQGNVVGLHTGQIAASNSKNDLQTVKVIEGCEHLSDDAIGLSMCAQLLEKALGNLEEY
jgi:hypothetical protein